MQHLRGLLGWSFCSRSPLPSRRTARESPGAPLWRPLLLQAGFAALVLRWGPGRDALSWVSDHVTTLIG
jgi:CNT family concentrative nucleoside transporter